MVIGQIKQSSRSSLELFTSCIGSLLCARAKPSLDSLVHFQVSLPRIVVALPLFDVAAVSSLHRRIQSDNPKVQQRICPI